VKAEPAIFLSVIASGALLSGAVLLAKGVATGGSSAAGAGIAVANLWALRGIVQVLVASAAGSRSSSGLGFFLGPKLLALFGVVWLLLSRHVVSAGPLAIGYASLPIGVAIGALVCEKPGP